MINDDVIKSIQFSFSAEELEHLKNVDHPQGETLGHNHYHDGEHNADFDHQVSLITMNWMMIMMMRMRMMMAMVMVMRLLLLVMMMQ